MIAPVLAPGAAASFAAAQRAVWSSLPTSLGAGGHGQHGGHGGHGGRAVAVDGRDASWPDEVERLAGSEGAAVLVVEPSLAPGADRLRDLASVAARVPLIVQRDWAGHPAVAGLAGSLAPMLGALALVDSVATVPPGTSWPGVLAGQLAALRDLGIRAVEVDDAACTPGAYAVHAHSGDTAIVLAGVRTAVPAPVLDVTAYAPDAQAHLRVVADGTAAPADVRIVGPDGATTAPTWFEGAGRASWRRVVEAVRDGTRPRDVDGLVTDATVWAHIVDRWHDDERHHDERHHDERHDERNR